MLGSFVTSHSRTCWEPTDSAKGCTRFVGRADEIGNDSATCFDDPITHPAHPTRVLQAVGVGFRFVRLEQRGRALRLERVDAERRQQAFQVYGR